jgi:hypothetical protein
MPNRIDSNKELFCQARPQNKTNQIKQQPNNTTKVDCWE